MYKIMIITDSMSAIEGIENNKGVLCIPSHIGILENEIAHSLAQSACQYGTEISIGFLMDEILKKCEFNIMEI